MTASLYVVANGHLVSVLTDHELISQIRMRFRCYPRTMTGRITIEAEKRSGQPCIRGLRITVWDVLSWLAAGMTEQEILDDYPELERSDFQAIYEFAVRIGRRVAL